MEPNVISASTILEGTLAGAERSSLLILGVSEVGPVEQLLFGALPECVAIVRARAAMIVNRYPRQVESSIHKLRSSSPGKSRASSPPQII